MRTKFRWYGFYWQNTLVKNITTLKCSQTSLLSPLQMPARNGYVASNKGDKPMLTVGIGLPGKSLADVRVSAEAAAPYAFDSFSVYGDLYDLPPYGVLPAAAEALRGTSIQRIGPLGVPVGLLHPEVIAAHALALEE